MDNLQHSLTPFIRWNLDESARFSKLPELTLTMSAAAVVDRVNGWLPLIVVDQIRFVEGPSVGVQPRDTAAQRPGPPRIPTPLELHEEDLQGGDWRFRFEEALNDLKPALADYEGSVTPRQMLAMWLCAAALTAYLRHNIRYREFFVAPEVSTGDLGVGTPRDFGQRLDAKTILVLPIYRLTKAMAATEVGQRIRTHMGALIAGESLRTSSLVELRQLLYFHERTYSFEPKFPANEPFNSCDVRLAKMIHIMQEMGLASSATEAQRMLDRARIIPTNGWNNNDVQTHDGRIRFNAIWTLALRRYGLLKPGVFRQFGSLITQRKIAKRLLKEGLDADVIEGLCGLQLPLVATKD